MSPTPAPSMPETQATSAIPVVHVIDDEPSICQLIESVTEIVGARTKTYGKAEAFLEDYDPKLAGCLFLDLHLPAMSGLELLAEMSRRKWRLPIVVISGRADVSHAVAAFKGGSIDFLEKPFGTEEIEAAMRNALEIDRETRTRDARSRDAETLRSEIQGRIQKLTPRERQVLDLVVQGKPNRLIAENLGVSPKTIEVHRANVMQKMQAESLAELVRMTIAARTDPTLS